MSCNHSKPLVGVVANRSYDSALATQAVDEKYLDALIDLSDVDVAIIPALTGTRGRDALLDRVDGLLLTGAATNIHPSYFDPDANEGAHKPFDTGRDTTAFDLIAQAMARDMPILAICRGMQELNVHFGGTMTADITADPERHCHQPWNKAAALDTLYGPSHEILPVRGGWLERLVDGLLPLAVNSLHVQSVGKLGEGIEIEAVAPDGTVEAIRIAGSRFGIGVQWHPEFAAKTNPLSARLFSAFGDEVRAFRHDKFRDVEHERCCPELIGGCGV